MVLTPTLYKELKILNVIGKKTATQQMGKWIEQRALGEEAQMENW